MNTVRCSGKSVPVNPFRVEARRRAGRILRSATATRWLVQAVFNRSDQFRARLGEFFSKVQYLVLPVMWERLGLRHVPSEMHAWNSPTVTSFFMME